MRAGEISLQCFGLGGSVANRCNQLRWTGLSYIYIAHSSAGLIKELNCHHSFGSLPKMISLIAMRES